MRPAIGGRKTALIAGLGVLGVLGGVASAFWKDLALEYHSFRLDRARSLEEARPWLERIASEADGERASSFIQKLGREHPTLTGWFFLYLRRLAQEGDAKSSNEPFPHQPGPLVSLSLAFGHRLERDPELLSHWAHFILTTLSGSGTGSANG